MTYKTFITTQFFPKKKTKNNMTVFNQCESAKNAQTILATADSVLKNEILKKIAEEVVKSTPEILSANAIDMKNGENLSPVMKDRLRLDDVRIKKMAEGVEALISLPDPVGRLLSEHTTKDDLIVKRISVPIGVVGVIYEARPNVTVDVASLCIKSGNSVVLRGGKDAIHSNRALAKAVKTALAHFGMADCVQFIDDETRESTAKLLQADKFVDVIIPRGGEKLKQYVLANTTIPVICSAGGVCHTYVDESANLEMAKKIVKNAKLSRPSVCNALETILVHEKIADKFLPAVLSEMKEEKNVIVFGDQKCKEIYPDTTIIDENGYYVEHLDYKVSVRVVKDISDAIKHINKYGTHHSDAIITDDTQKADTFVGSVDSADVYVNASTRFTDGFEFGLGAEIAISTQKLHARGPVGLNELTTYKNVILGKGQIRV